MADFISALTGVQMDQALMDMAEHNSEAYAVGERNGIAVASDDVTYHNNARYYAQIASSQIVGDASSAVRWDTDQSEVLTDAQKAVARNNINAASDSDVVKITSQTLTSAEQEQARANIMAGGSNRNLLDNPWWGSGEVVNQRGVTAQPSSNGTYCIDRWVWTTGATANTMSLTANGLAFTIASSSVWFAQRGVYAKILSGKTYTASVMLSDGTIKSGTGTVNTGTQTTFYTDSQLTLYLSTDGTFTCTVRATQTIRAVKLELGSVSTLANDAPPDYGEELAKCQYRCVVYNLPQNFIFCRGVATSTTNIRAVIDLPTNLAKNAFTITSTTNLSTPQGNTITAISYSSTLPRNNKIVVDCTSTRLTSWSVYDVFTAHQTPQIIISADL